MAQSLLRQGSSSNHYGSIHSKRTFTINTLNGNSTQRLTVLSTLGHGSFGEVFEVEDDRGHLFALKKISCKNSDIHDRKARTIQDLIGGELYAMLNLSHPHIVCLYSFDFEGIVFTFYTII